MVTIFNHCFNIVEISGAYLISLLLFSSPFMFEPLDFTTSPSFLLPFFFVFFCL